MKSSYWIVCNQSDAQFCTPATTQHNRLSLLCLSETNLSSAHSTERVSLFHLSHRAQSHLATAAALYYYIMLFVFLFFAIWYHLKDLPRQSLTNSVHSIKENAVCWQWCGDDEGCGHKFVKRMPAVRRTHGYPASHNPALIAHTLLLFPTASDEGWRVWEEAVHG